MFISLFVAGVVVALASSSPLEKADCICWPWHGDVTDLSCDDPSLTSVPDCVPSDVRILSIKTPTIPLVAETFERFTNLPRLNIQYIEKPEMAKDALRYLRNLNYFEFYRTGVDYIDNEWFMYSPHVKTVSLNDNKLTSLAPDTFGYLPVVEEVFLQGNQLTSLSPVLFEGTSLKKLFLNGNPWHCDCELATLVQWTRDHGVTIDNKSSCVQPPELAGVLLRDLSTSVTCK